MVADAPDPVPGVFHPTRWSLVLRARGEGEPARRALAELCQAYWFPLYAWCRRHGLPPADAEDAVQGFLLEALRKNLFAAADAERGRLRAFLLTGLRRHVRDERRREWAERRGGGRLVSFDATEAESWYRQAGAEGADADALFDRQWALAVLERALRRVEAQAIARGKQEEFTALRPFLDSPGEAGAYTAVGARLGLTEGAVKVAVHRLRGRFAEALHAEVADTGAEGAGIDEEIRHLRLALSGA
jgi:RNA polymerase sigma-70 factor (ECF subfamily)